MGASTILELPVPEKRPNESIMDIPVNRSNDVRERCLGPRAVSVSPLPDAHQDGQVQVATITNSYTTMDIAAEYTE